MNVQALELAVALARSQSSSVQRYVPHRPTLKQRAFLELRDCREVLYGGAAGGGKSDALLAAALEYFHVPGYSAILFRRTYADLALPEAIMDRSHDWLAGKAEWNDRDKTWTSREGATLTFGYLDGPRDHLRYQGAAFQFVGFDELSQFLLRQYTYLFSRLRRLKGFSVPLRMRGATNPGDIGHEWVKERFAIPDTIDFDRVYEAGARKFVPARLEDNAHLDRDEYELALAELDPVTREQLRFGKWVRDAAGLVYSVERVKQLTPRLPSLPFGETWRHVLGLDFGFIDATAFAVLAFTEHSDSVYVVAAGAWEGLTPSAAAEEIRKLEAQYSFDAIVGDVGGLGKGYAEEARQRFTIPVEPAEKANKLGYIKLLNGDLANGKLLFVAGTAEETLGEMERLAWADEKRNKEHPALPNHRCDALLYGWRKAKHWAWEPRTEKRFADPSEQREVEQWDREQRRAKRVGQLLGLTG